MKVNNGKRLHYRSIVLNHLLTRDTGLCRYCRSPIDTSFDCDIDHNVSTADGGSNDLDNLIAVHQSCHKEKHHIVISKKINPKHVRTKGVIGFGGMVRKRVYAETKFKIDAFIADGKNITWIAKAIGVSRPTVYDILNRKL